MHGRSIWPSLFYLTLRFIWQSFTARKAVSFDTMLQWMHVFILELPVRPPIEQRNLMLNRLCDWLRLMMILLRNKRGYPENVQNIARLNAWTFQTPTVCIAFSGHPLRRSHPENFMTAPLTSYNLVSIRNRALNSIPWALTDFQDNSGRPPIISLSRSVHRNANMNMSCVMRSQLGTFWICSARWSREDNDDGQADAGVPPSAGFHGRRTRHGLERPGKRKGNHYLVQGINTWTPTIMLPTRLRRCVPRLET